MNPGINHGNASHNVAISCDRKVQRMPFLLVPLRSGVAIFIHFDSAYCQSLAPT